MLQPAVFIDRDGTLIEYALEPTKKEHIVLLPHAAEAIKKFNEVGFLVIVHTNQPIIEKGLITQEESDSLNKYMIQLFAEKGARLDVVYTCPHRFKEHEPCRCRKPEVGLLEDAQKDFEIDMQKSWLIGDTTRDMETAKRAGLKSILVLTGDGGKDREYFQTEGDFVAKDLLVASEIIARQYLA